MAAFEQCQATAVTALGESHTLSLLCLGLRGLILETMGRYPDALSVLERHLTLSSRIIGGSHPVTPRTMHSLADVHRGLEQYDAAEGMFLEVPALRREALDNKFAEFGFEHPTTLIAAQEMAELLIDSEQLDAAGELLERIMSARQQVLGAEHPDLVGTLLGLAQLSAQAGA